MAFLSFFPYNFTAFQWFAVLAGSVCFGISKTGLNGVSVIAIPLFAMVFGAKNSTGTVLPLLCFADLFAVVYYRRHAEWKYVGRLVPWAVAGFGLALLADRFVTSDRDFKMLIGICVFAGLVFMLWNDFAVPAFRKRRKGEAPEEGNAGRDAQNAGQGPDPGSTTEKNMPQTSRLPVKVPWYAPLFGIMGGFSTMIGNSAGPVMSVFMLSVKLPKESFVGTAAWFFLMVNYLKVPLQAFVWHNISLQSVIFDLFLIPSVLLGVWLGIQFVKKVNDAQYRIAAYVLTLVSTILLIL